VGDLRPEPHGIEHLLHGHDRPRPNFDKTTTTNNLFAHDIYDFAVVHLPQDPGITLPSSRQPRKMRRWPPGSH
jgi:hypothetical protein